MKISEDLQKNNMIELDLIKEWESEHLGYEIIMFFGFSWYHKECHIKIVIQEIKSGYTRDHGKGLKALSNNRYHDTEKMLIICDCLWEQLEGITEFYCVSDWMIDKRDKQRSKL
jgi:hypothetical protein